MTLPFEPLAADEVAGLLTGAEDFLAVADLEGRCRWLNRFGEDYDLHEIVGADFRSFFPKEAKASLNAAFDAARERREVLEVNATTTRGLPVLVRVSPIVIGDEVVAVLIGGLTRTKLHAHERERAFLELAQEASGIGLWRWNVRTNEAVWDERVKAIYGFAPGAPLTFEEVNARTHPEDAERAAAHVRRALETKRWEPIEIRILVDDEVRWVLSLGRARLDPDGEVTDLLGGVMDITEQRRQRERSQRLEKVEAMGRLASGIAHDFNNLLVTLQGSLELLEQGRASPGAPRGETWSEEETSLFEEAQDACTRAAELTQGLLAFCRRGEQRRVRLSLPRVAEGTARLLRRLLPEHVELTVAASEPITVLAERQELEQLVMNLCLNARDAMLKTGGAIEVAVERVPGEPHPQACLRVRDEGRGIPQRDLERIFEPLFTTRASGTGLGLATAEAIVERHGGRIEVESEEGRGTEFRVYLPARDEAPEAEAPPRPRARRATPRSGRILVAEDELPVRRTLARLLRREGYEVVLVEDGRRAIEAIDDEGPFDLAILDAIMPQQSGLEVAAHARAVAPDMPLALHTGYVDAFERRDELFDAVLSKPHPTDELLHVVAELVEGQPAPNDR